MAMSFYHVRITTKAPNSTIEVELDVGAEELEPRFLEPYRHGRPIVIAGRTVTSSELERIQISETQYASDLVNKHVRARDERRNVVRPVDTRGRLDPMILAQDGVDVTKRYIKGPPGHDVEPQKQTAREIRPARDARHVFVVHGRNHAAREAMFAFLRSIGLDPLEWSEAVASTGKSLPYIGEILDAAFSRAHAVLVLFTPDDEARMAEQFLSANDPPHETQLTGQARPNVLFEAGMAMGRNPDRTILVELGNLRPFSDVGGRHVIRMDGSSQRRQELAQRLQAIGCPVNLEGTDWHTAGDFRAVMEVLSQVESAPIRTQQNNPPHLHVSEHARSLLVAAYQSGHASIIKVNHLHGSDIRSGDEDDSPREARSIAAREEGLNELMANGLVRRTKEMGDVESFALTTKGFEVADILSQQEATPDGL